jgi:hypothetical protein
VSIENIEIKRTSRQTKLQLNYLCYAMFRKKRERKHKREKKNLCCEREIFLLSFIFFFPKFIIKNISEWSLQYYHLFTNTGMYRFWLCIIFGESENKNESNFSNQIKTKLNKAKTKLKLNWNEKREKFLNLLKKIFLRPVSFFLNFSQKYSDFRFWWGNRRTFHFLLSCCVSLSPKVIHNQNRYTPVVCYDLKLIFIVILQACIGSGCVSLLARVRVNNENSSGFLTKLNIFVRQLRTKNWA